MSVTNASPCFPPGLFSSKARKKGWRHYKPNTKFTVTSSQFQVGIYNSLGLSECNERKSLFFPKFGEILEISCTKIFRRNFECLWQQKADDPSYTTSPLHQFMVISLQFQVCIYNSLGLSEHCLNLSKTSS